MYLACIAKAINALAQVADVPRHRHKVDVTKAPLSTGRKFGAR